MRMPGMEGMHIDEFEYEPFEIDEAVLGSATDEEPFAHAAFELHRDLGKSLVLVAGALRLDEAGEPRGLTLDEAVLAGLIVRCMKLQHGILGSAAPQRLELVNFFMRGIVESAVNLRYLLLENSPELFERFRRYSLRTDAALRRRIETNIVERGDEPWPIELRMLEGIARAFELSGVDPGEVDPDDRSDWAGSIYRRFEAVDLKELYVAFFSVQSHYTHGNWHDLFAYHLGRTEDGKWMPAVQWSPVRPQPLLASLTVLASAATDYLVDVAEPSPDRDVLYDRITTVYEKGQRVDELHERSLAQYSRADQS
jgi:Family of unknown function (DUF5677)